MNANDGTGAPADDVFAVDVAADMSDREDELSEDDIDAMYHDHVQTLAAVGLMNVLAEDIAAGDLESATETLADAIANLDAIGERDPGGAHRLGSRLMEALRDLSRAREEELDALVAGPAAAMQVAS